MVDAGAEPTYEEKMRVPPWEYYTLSALRSPEAWFDSRIVPDFHDWVIIVRAHQRVVQFHSA